MSDILSNEEAREALSRNQFRSEADFQFWLRKRAHEFGWLYHHNYDSRRSDPGFPDTVMVRGDRIIFAELKTPKGRISDPQTTWLEALGGVDVESYIWRYEDVDRILEILQR